MKLIAQDIASGAGMELVYDAEDNPTLDRAEQTEQSDLSFLMQLCEDQGMALKICRNQIVIFDESKYEETAPVLALVKPGTAYLPEEGMTYITAIKGYRFPLAHPGRVPRVSCGVPESGHEGNHRGDIHRPGQNGGEDIAGERAGGLHRRGGTARQEAAAGEEPGRSDRFF